MNKQTQESRKRFARAGFAVVLGAACLAVLALKSRRPDAQAQQQENKLITVRTIQTNAGMLGAVELRCDNAELSAPNAVDKISCTLTNKGESAITAGTLATTLNLLRDGKTQPLTIYDTFDTFLHPDFREEHPTNVIAPGQSYRLESTHTTYDGLVTDITASVDYIEFADGRTAGSDQSGSRIVGNLREGARKYKAWIVKKFNEKGRSVDAILSLLSESQSLPQELLLTNSDQEHGARLYRTHAQRTYQSRGREVLARQLIREP